MIYDLQKANMWKRISAYLLDLILLCIIAVGFALLLSSVLGYNEHSEAMEGYYETYEKEYDIDFDISSADYEALSKEEKDTYDKALVALSADEEASRTYSLLINLSMIITTFGILLAYLIMELAVPLLLKNGQTLGKKVFGICLVRVDCVKVTPFMLFVRSVLGKFTVETMFPLALCFMFFLNGGLVAPLVVVLLLILQIALLFATKNHMVIHDSFAQTVVVDMASQKIFGSAEELLEYKKKIHAEAVS